MRNQIALFLSYLLHPALIPLLSVMTFFLLTPFHYNEDLMLWVLVIVFVGTYAFPALSVLLLKRLGFIESIHLLEPKDRKLPFLIGAIFYFLTGNIIHQFSLEPFFSAFFTGGGTVIFIGFLLLRWVKMSAHSAAFAGWISVVLFISITFKTNLTAVLVVLILLGGILGSARIALGAHSLREVLIGYLVGGSVMFGVLRFMSLGF